MIEKNYLSDIELKRELTLILECTDRYLRENNISYTIYGGTFLGAIRHQGFIPWDDDIDIAILRKDYERLISILKKSNGKIDQYKAIGYELGEKDWPYLKIVNPQIMVEDGTNNIDDYLWIDVFPIDAIPDKNRSMHLFNIHYILRKLYFVKRSKRYQFVYENKGFVKKIYNGLLRIIACMISEEKITEKYIKTCSKYDTEKNRMVGEVVWGNEMFPKKYFDSIIDYSFEGIMVKGFKNHHDYLTIMYNNYMTIPPEEERVNHSIVAWRTVQGEK